LVACTLFSRRTIQFAVAVGGEESIAIIDDVNFLSNSASQSVGESALVLARSGVVEMRRVEVGGNQDFEVRHVFSDAWQHKQRVDKRRLSSSPLFIGLSLTLGTIGIAATICEDYNSGCQRRQCRLSASLLEWRQYNGRDCYFSGWF
jgi:hypothetical protein